MDWPCPTTTVTSAWGTPRSTRRQDSPRSWCPVLTVAAQVPPTQGQGSPSRHPVPEGLVACQHPVAVTVNQVTSLLPDLRLPVSLAPPHRASVLPPVHPRDDGSSEDLPLAVHRVQVLQHLWHLRERCACVIPSPSAPRPQHAPAQLLTVLSTRGNFDLFGRCSLSTDFVSDTVLGNKHAKDKQGPCFHGVFVLAGTSSKQGNG